MKAMLVSSKDVFDKKKNPKMQLSFESIFKNPRIKKKMLKETKVTKKGPFRTGSYRSK